MRLFPPNRPRHGVVLLVGVATLAFVHSSPIMRWSYGDTAAMSAEFRQAVLLMGIFSAACAAWVAGDLSSPRKVFAPPGSIRRGAPLAWANLAYLGLAGCIGLTAGMAPAVIDVASQKTYGSFDLATILSGYACLLCYVGVGYVVGCVLPGYLSVPAAIVLSYGLVLLPSTVLSPAFDFDVISGTEVPVRVSEIRIAFFLGVVGSTAAAATVWLRQRTPAELLRAVVAVSIAMAPVLVVGLAANTYSGFLVVADQARPLCRKAGASTVCVHPARSTMLNGLEQSVDAIARAGQIIFPPARVLDATLVVPHGGAREMRLHLQGQSAQWLGAARTDIAAQSAGLDVCFQSGQVGSPAMDVSSAVAAWLAALMGGDARQLLQTPGARRTWQVLEGMDAAAARSTVEAVIVQVRLCRQGSLPS